MNRFLQLALLLMLASFLGIAPCQARLDDTLDECIARYGQPVSPMDMADSSGGKIGRATFQKNGYVVQVILLGGFVEGEVFAKSDKSAFTDTEKKILLNADSAYRMWKWSTDSDGNDMWTSDLADQAIYNSGEHYLMISSKKGLLRLQSAARAEQENKLRGF